MTVQPAQTDPRHRATARLRLRPVTEADAGPVVALHTDPRNYPHSGTGVPSVQRARSMLQMFAQRWQRDGIGYWVVEHEGAVVGVAGVTPSPLRGRQAWNLYYRFVPEARGRGIAGEATREALVVADALHPDWPVVVRTRPGNEPAKALAVSIGLVRRPDLDEDGYFVFVSHWPTAPAVS